MSEITTTVHESITEVKRGEWNAIVAQQSRTGSAFERYEYLRAYEDATDEPPRHVQVRKNGTLVGVLPTFRRPFPGTPFRYLGPPKPGFSSPMIATDEANVLAAMLDTVGSMTGGRTVGHVIKAASNDGLRYAERLGARNYAPSVRDCRFTLDVDRPWDEVEGDLDQKKRRNLRKADEAGVTAEQTPVTDDAIREFSARHDAHMARIGGDGASYELLEAMREYAGDRLLMTTCRVDGEVAGQTLAVRDDERDRLFLLFPAYDPDAFSHYASETLYRREIQWASEQGYDRVDFGETTPDFADGVFTFKSEFGGEPVPSLRWERLDSRVLRAFYAAGGDRLAGRILGGRGGED